jgi:beta-glucosidase
MRSLYEKYNAPVFITENGTCDARDAFRAAFIFDHLKIVADSGLPVERYYYWTLMDNFEWAEGETARFGLVAYDFVNAIPTPRKSANFYKEIILHHGVTQEMIDEYI